jgi:hypothetical protein
MTGLTKLVLALMQVESSGNSHAKRYEPAFRTRYVPAGLTEEEAHGRATSWGYWQLMGQVLRELGYNGSWSEFCDSDELQLHYATKLARRNAKSLGPNAAGWRHVEAWNKGAGGAKKLSEPTAYYRKVMKELEGLA